MVIKIRIRCSPAALANYIGIRAFARGTSRAGGGQSRCNYAAVGRQHGLVAMFAVVCLVVLAVGMMPAALSLSSTLTKDSVVKTDIVKRHYAALSGELYARHELLNDGAFIDSLVPGVPSSQQLDLNGKIIDVTVTELEPSDPGNDDVSVQADIVLTLDVSTDVDSSELLLLMNASVTIVDNLNMSASNGGIRMGVQRFAGSSASVTAMTEDDEPDVVPPVIPLRDGINGLVQGGPGLSAGTNLIQGLQGSSAQFTTGLGDRLGVPNIIVMITDGDDNGNNNSGDNDNPATLGAASDATGAEIFVVGIGNKIKLNSIKAMASDDDPDDPGYQHNDPTAGHRYHLNNFAALLGIIEDLSEKVIQSAQTRVFKIVSIVDGLEVESLVAVGFDGSGNLQSWTIK